MLNWSILPGICAYRVQILEQEFMGFETVHLQKSILLRNIKHCIGVNAVIGAKGLLDQYLLYFLLEQTNSSTDIIIGYRSANTATTYSAFHLEEL